MFFLNLIGILLISYAVCWVFSAFALKLLKLFKVGQSIREEGPLNHRKKSGVPTLGGIGIILSILLLFPFFLEINFKILALLLLFLGYALIGFVDDFTKVNKARNLGLTFWQKIFAQSFFAFFLAWILVATGYNFTVTGLLKFLHFELLFLYIPFIMFIIMGSSNAVNLTDGLDGLAAGLLTLAFLTYGLLAAIGGHREVAVFCMIVAGSTLAFLYFNRFPAKMFMGDVGSLSLGALLAGVAALIHKELILAIIGAVFVAEALSVIIQVAYFKTTGRRIFKMSPLHHHFELSGVSEPQIVIGFWKVALIFALLGLLIGLF